MIYRYLWYEDYGIFLKTFEEEKYQESMDETVFCFQNDPKNEDHYLGCLLTKMDGSPCDKPYWAGYCDIPNGCMFETARELLEAPIYNGHSIAEQWYDINICQIGGLDPVEWTILCYDGQYFL